MNLVWSNGEGGLGSNVGGIDGDIIIEFYMFHSTGMIHAIQGEIETKSNFSTCTFLLAVEAGATIRRLKGRKCESWRFVAGRIPSILPLVAKPFAGNDCGRSHEAP